MRIKCLAQGHYCRCQQIRFEPGTSRSRVCGLIHWATTAPQLHFISCRVKVVFIALWSVDSGNNTLTKGKHLGLTLPRRIQKPSSCLLIDYQWSHMMSSHKIVFLNIYDEPTLTYRQLVVSASAALWYRISVWSWSISLEYLDLLRKWLHNFCNFYFHTVRFV